MQEAFRIQRVIRNRLRPLVPRRVMGAMLMFGCLVSSCLGDGTAVQGTEPKDAGHSQAIEYFEKQVRAVLVGYCYNCHSAETKAAAGLRVDDRNGLLQGGRSGAAIVPGKPAQSLLIQVVKYEHAKVAMPPEKQLEASEIAILEKWIQDGAVWPSVALPEEIGELADYYETLKQEHWSWQPLRAVSPPLAGTGWATSVIDQFVAEKREQAGLQPVADADRETLIRRVTYDLTGLPPTVEEVDQFLADDSAEAFERVVDRLLASSAYGERWGRHWLDVARFGESTGSSRNLPYPHAWRYRDYVIDAFNADVPYNRFVQEQIAGDLLPSASEQERQRQMIATGFLAIGVKDVNQRFTVRYDMDNIDEQIDTVTRDTLGLTVSCARCHDHKFDPIPTADYYALAGIFKSSELCDGLRNQMGGGGLAYYVPAKLIVLNHQAELSAEQQQAIERLKKRVQQAKKEFEDIRDGVVKPGPGQKKQDLQRPARQKWQRLEGELKALNDPASLGEVAVGMREAATVADTEIRIRGEAELLGPVVARGFLTAFDVADAPAIPATESGRLQLAQWLTSEHNPLAQRVIVNRVWQHLFGRGIVSTVDNFGLNGDEPTHPELLDYLAQRFVEQGWSLKSLIRELVLSRSYQLAAATTPENLTVDPANTLLWRHAPRRMSAEEIRDSLLAVAQHLQAERHAGSPAQELQVRELRNNGPEARTLEQYMTGHQHRSVYLPLLRGLVPHALQVFDFAEQGMVTGQRDTTTVAPQALYLLNDPFVRKQAVGLASRLLQQTELNDYERIDHAYRQTLHRLPTPEEKLLIERYLAEYEEALNVQGFGDADQFAEVSSAVSTEHIAPQGESLQTALKNTAENAIDPDSIDQSDAPVVVESVEIADSRTAAWASFCQALFSSAEFLYID